MMSSPLHAKRWCRALILSLVLATKASCLATSSIPSHPKGKLNAQDDSTMYPKTAVVSTKKNGGHSQVYPNTKDILGKDNTKKSFGIQGLASMIQRGSQNFQAAIRSTFLPSGYPLKTPPGYLNYAIWSWIQDLSTQLRSVLATQKILEGVGVGREGATALSALMNFLARDGCGMIATLLFTSVASSRFRADVKRWRLVADIAVDIGITLEIAAVATPPNLFLPMICLGNMCKAICGVAAGACGGSINLHWAQGSDISDINAKFGAQNTITGMVGLIFAALFARSVASWKLWKLWILYSALTLLHIVANIRCMRLIDFQSLNNVRLNIVLQDFLQWWDLQSQSSSDNVSSTAAATPILSTPSKVSKMEPLFFLPKRFYPRQNAIHKRSVPIFFGQSFNEFCERSRHASGAEIAETLQTAPAELLDTAFGTDDYLVSAGVISASKRKLCVNVIFREDATPETEAKAYLHAILLGRHLKTLEKMKDFPLDNDVAVMAIEAKTEQEEIGYAWNLFQAGCYVAGWDLTKTEMQTMGYEVTTAVPSA
ncbi:RUS1 family protein C16orf58 homolog [Seminavis robusta]|uniref:RUS1 family protein C16orf58 homolog n=1 Tax=Seminavis robusta TaxID=568900 RepID=A0A9N8EF00_9STRA|nr:RUS1 family protein C16orf58 homolog [Seminavis robusta]|eukprot:Sro846_g210190.1 RUS1 family protein C16orf58 homolog (542) ;mRNA; f:33473-35098